MDLDDRMKEIKERYEKYASRSDFTEMIAAAKLIEAQISESTSDDVTNILTASSLEKHHSSLRIYAIK